MYYPTLKEARTLADSGPYREIPVARELLSDFLTPIQANVIKLRVGRYLSTLNCF